MFDFDGRVTGGIVDVINNPDGYYEGDLRHYAKIIFAAPNIHHGYHGLRHMLHVLWVCYLACDYYFRLGQLTPRRMRNLLIAAIFHDYGHSGKMGNDADNIRVAIREMRKALLPEDVEAADDIANIMRATEYPHRDLRKKLTLEQAIIRDADITQSFSTAWIGQIAGGLGSEWGKTPREMIELQRGFLTGIRFYTDFGKIFFGDEAILAKLTETDALLEILTS